MIIRQASQNLHTRWWKDSKRRRKESEVSRPELYIVTLLLCVLPVRVSPKSSSSAEWGNESRLLTGRATKNLDRFCNLQQGVFFQMCYSKPRAFMEEPQGP